MDTSVKKGIMRLTTHCDGTVHEDVRGYFFQNRDEALRLMDYERFRIMLDGEEIDGYFRRLY